MTSSPRPSPRWRRAWCSPGGNPGREPASRLVRGAGSCIALLLVACGAAATAPVTGGPAPQRPALDQAYRASGHAAAGDLFVHLFEWPWNDIATECEQVLGPAGVAAVQVSPPQEHSITPNHDWSERYQPVSYSVARSRSGTGAEFASMVSRCRAAGVGIYVDAVINHMTNFPSPGTGSNGTAYTKYSYPGLYTPADFHTPCTVSNYQDAANVQDCELFGLPDLDTGRPTVRQSIAGYLVSLARLGVAGFRIDAAKHIQQVELDQIFTLVDSTLRAEGKTVPYYFLEVSAGAGEALSPRDYFGEGYKSGAAADITEFTFTGVGDKFREVGGQFIAQLNPAGPQGAQFSPAAWNLMPPDKAVVFLQNHDTQRQCGIGYQDGAVFRLATVWMLAQPYGYPSVLSGYVFQCPAQTSLGPPSDAQGITLPVSCPASIEAAVAGGWVCEHRDRAILAMVGFRRLVAGTDVNRWWSSGPDAVAFSRGGAGFVALNRSGSALVATVSTGLGAGTYCDLISGGRSGSACAGASITVDGTGAAAIRLASRSAVAIDTAAHL